MIAKISRQQSGPGFRTRFIVSVFVLIFLVILYRLYDIQIGSAKEYKAIAEDQQSLVAKLMPARGEIKVYDKYSTKAFTVATNIKQPLVYVVPSQIIDVEKTASTLADILKIDKAVLKDKLLLAGRSYVPLKKNLTEEESKAITSLNLGGVQLDYEVSRYYPEQDLLSHVLGFVGFRKDSGSTKVGVYGLEKSFEENLAGQAGSLKSVKDAKGLWLLGGDKSFQAQEDGQQLILTIDRTIQLNVERVLKATVEKHQADGGCIVVMNPTTGAILAMASNPTFNPNEYNKIPDQKVFQNLCTQGNYEPGSVFKPVTMAGALDVGSVTPETTFDDTAGEVEIAGYTIKNSDNQGHGVQNMVQVLEKSLNTGMIFVERSMGNLRFKQYVEKFGFGQRSGIEVSEGLGGLRNLESNIEVNFATAAFGQGISVTPIQMVKAYSAFANKGKMVKPFLVQSEVMPNGEVKEQGGDNGEQVISAKTASTIGAMLVSVVENGHGKRAAVKGYFVAGKTGTAQVAKSDGRGYDANNNIGTFIGYAPVEDPRFVMLVRVDHPRTVQFAESTAAPAFGELAQFLLSYFNVPPTRIEGK